MDECQCSQLMRSASWHDKRAGLECYRSHPSSTNPVSRAIIASPALDEIPRIPAVPESSLELTGDLTSSLPSPCATAPALKKRKLEPISNLPKTIQVVSSPYESLAEDPNPRLKLTMNDFVTDSVTTDRLQDIVTKFPELLKRNFYVLQRHWATARHYDLRLHLDGLAISFCIPRGLSGFDKEQSGTVRLAIDTNPHPLSYSLFEGGGKHVTGVWDIGSYFIRETQAATTRGTADTDDEDDNSCFTADEHQENRFAEKYYNARFIDLPSRYGESAVRTNPDRGHKRAFVIELQGARHKGLRLRFMRGSDDFSLTAHGKQENYTIAIDNNGPRAVENTKLGDRSVLSQKTMEQIRVEMSSVVWNAAGSPGGGARGC